MTGQRLEQVGEVYVGLSVGCNFDGPLDLSSSIEVRLAPTESPLFRTSEGC